MMLFPLDIRWRIALMLCVITTINYLDRQALSIAAPSLMEDFSISNTQYGWITSAFLFTYALGQLLSGPIIDRLGTKRGFNLAVVVWSVAGMLHVLGRGFVSFFSLRGLLGFGEAANFPAALKAIAEWFPRAERSMAVGILTVGPGLGAVLSPPLLGFIIYTLGWQAAFIIPGLLGFVWLWWWQRMYHLPEAHPNLARRELELILSGREKSTEGSVRPRLRVFLGYREVWGLMLSRFVSDGAFYFFVFWVPLYLSSERGFNIIEIGLFAWIPFLAADVGSLAGGWSGQDLIRRGMSVNAARKWVIWVGALMVPLALPAVMVDSPVLAIALIGGAMFAIQFKASSLFTLPADLFPARDVATVWGLYGAVAAMHIVSAVLINVFIPRIELITGADQSPVKR